MHELTITESILNIALEELKKHGGTRVREIRICTGPFSGIVPECVQTYFDLLSEGTPAWQAKLIYRRLPLKVKCLDCGLESDLPGGTYTCPGCGSMKLHRLSGSECLVESLEID